MSAIVSKKLKYVVITHGDSYLGQTLAMHIADQLDKGQGQLKRKHRAVRVLCQDKKALEHLERRGIEVMQVDYESQHTIVEQIQKIHIKTMIFNPFAATMGRMVECGNNVLEAALRKNVKRIVMISSYGVDTLDRSLSTEETPIAQFKMMESHMRHHYKYGSWAIYRIPFIQQYMYFWSQMLENKNMLGMPISEGDMLVSVNIKDVLDCVAIASLSKKSVVWASSKPQHHLEASTMLATGSEPNNSDTLSSSDESNDNNDSQVAAMKHVYELTSEPLSLVMMSDAMSRALHEAGSSFDVDSAVVSDEQLETYLKHVAKSDKKGDAAAAAVYDDELNGILSSVATITNIRTDVSSVNSRDIDSFFLPDPQSRSFLQEDCSFINAVLLSKDQEHQDSPDLYPCPATTLTPFCIQLIMNHFRIARNSMPPMAPNNDIRDITGRAPIPMDIFFMLNRKLFRPE